MCNALVIGYRKRAVIVSVCVIVPPSFLRAFSQSLSRADTSMPACLPVPRRGVSSGVRALIVRGECGVKNAIAIRFTVSPTGRSHTGMLMQAAHPRSLARLSHVHRRAPLFSTLLLTLRASEGWIFQAHREASRRTRREFSSRMLECRSIAKIRTNYMQIIL